MNDIPRIITGAVLVLIGIGLCSLPLFTEQWFSLISGIPILIVGIVILLNKHENKIEEVRKK
jgi:uncharacterized membrane protein HdeD (DUF308 family)